ncbi:MAG: helix-turn-helix domain-containing protein [Ruminococcaceae bacterium]|nr:helix-turn-helix domain-containing protein [Oscillospiraceae bacterium]
MPAREENSRLSLRTDRGNPHLSVEKRMVRGEFPVHWHSYFEIELITEGSGTHICNGEAYRISPGSVYILNPTDFHSIIPDAGQVLHLWNISFDEEMISERRLCELSCVESEKCFHLPTKAAARLCAVADLLAAETMQKDGGCTKELCESFLCMLMRHSMPRPAAAQSHISGIRRALLYMEVHFRENPSLTQTAAQAGFHPHYFSQMFRKVTGETYTVRLNSLRVGYAKMLLSKGFSVTETCYNSGFGSLSNFLTVFKKLTGFTPEEYRKGKR